MLVVIAGFHSSPARWVLPPLLLHHWDPAGPASLALVALVLSGGPGWAGLVAGGEKGFGCVREQVLHKEIDGGAAWKMEYLNVKGWVEHVPRYFEG